MRVAALMMTRMLCSMTSSVTPSSRSRPSSATRPGIERWSTPPVTSSSMRSRGRVAIALTALVIAACGGSGGEPSGSGSDQIAADLAGSLSPEEAAEAAAAVNAFGFDLHRRAAEPGTNTVTSPLSASVLLAMVAAGAGGQTAAEMIEVLHLEEARDTRYAALLADLAGPSDVTLAVANALWAAEGYPFEEDYLGLVRPTFGATLEEVDLGAQEAADQIDAWVTERTEGLIEEFAEGVHRGMRMGSGRMATSLQAWCGQPITERPLF